MYLGRVIGTCVASRKYEGLEGVKLLVVQPLDEHRKPKGRIEVAVDVAQAGPDDFVFLVGSREASMALGDFGSCSSTNRSRSHSGGPGGLPPGSTDFFVPVDSAIVGIVDDLHVPELEAGR